MKFKPMLSPNEKVDLDMIQYPILASYKLDGLRIIFYKGEILSRSLKQIVNKQLRENFKPIADYSRENNLILDGEIYSHELTFQAIVRYVMTKDFEDKKSIKKHGKVLTIPEHLKFYCFDAVQDDNFGEDFVSRLNYAECLKIKFGELVVEEVEQFPMWNKTQVEDLFEVALEKGYEGLILKSFLGKYKCGRGTIKEGLIYKVKPYQTFDGVIVEVIQATKVDPNAEKKTNQLGRSETSKKIGDRILIEKASAFRVKYLDTTVKVVLAMTDDVKEEVWRNRESYIGKMIEYKGLMVGAKHVPRHPTYLRFLEKGSK